MGHDLNRHWQEPSPWSHPTLYATKNLLMEMDSNEVCQYSIQPQIQLNNHRCHLLLLSPNPIGPTLFTIPRG